MLGDVEQNHIFDLELIQPGMHLLKVRGSDFVSTFKIIKHYALNYAMSEPLFKESQRFRQPWLILLFIVLNLMFLFPLFQQLILGEPFGDEPTSNGELILISLLTLGISAVFFIFRLDTEISEEGISARLFPLHRKFRHFAWKDIQQIEVRQYKPLREYGGWGIRYGKNGKAWNVSGNQGIQLVFQNGKRLLIGTNDAESVRDVVNQLKLPTNAPS